MLIIIIVVVLYERNLDFLSNVIVFDEFKIWFLLSFFNWVLKLIKRID